MSQASTQTASSAPTLLSLVIFDVEFEPMDSSYTEEEVLLQVFAFTQAVRLRGVGKTKVQYQCGDYDQDENGNWVGAIECQRSSLTSSAYKDPERGFRFAQTQGGQVVTSEDRTQFAYNPKAHVIIYRDRATIPHTRLPTYVYHAKLLFQSAEKVEFKLKIVPRKTRTGLRQLLDSFTSISRIQLRYTHSRSPGDDFVDDVIEQLNADEIIETCRAKDGDTLNKSALIKKGDGALPIARAIDHIDKNAKNGGAKIRGKVGRDTIEADSRNAVERRIEESTGSDDLSVFKAISFFASRFMRDQPPAEASQLPPTGVDAIDVEGAPRRHKDSRPESQ